MNRKRYLSYGFFIILFMLWTVSITTIVQAEETSPIPTEPVADVEQSTFDEPDQNNDIVDQTTVENETVIEMSNEEAVKTADSANNEVNNGIPVIYLHIDESKGTIDAMNSDPDHNTYCYGTLDFTLPSDDFQYADLPSDLKEYYNLEMSIKGRGNNTWTQDKKPYKIKLDKKADLLGLGDDEKNKHWVLLANTFDPSLIKNRITSYLADQIGLEYTPIGVPVDLVMNDVYLGNYFLTEHVRVDSGRINIDELTESDVDTPTITGGYVVQNGTQTSPDAPSYFTTKSGEIWNNHTPSFDPGEGDYENDIQKEYIRSYMQMIEDILYSDTQMDDNGNPYSYYMDLPSAAKYWLINAVAKNNDAYETGSTYLYKKRDTENEIGKLYWGPVWDFDFSWGNTDRADGGLYEGFDSVLQGWILPMLHDTSENSFCEQILSEWPEVRELMLDMMDDNGIIDQYYEEMKQSREADQKVNPSEHKIDYSTYISNLKNWIQHRIQWIDANIQNLSNESRKIKICEEGKADIIYYLRNNTRLSKLETPQKEGFIFKGWATQDGEHLEPESTVTSDLILTPLFVSVDEATKYEEIIFRRDVDSILYDASATYKPQYSAFPADPELKKITWISSDNSIVSIDEEGTVTPLQTGTVTITATLPNGYSASYVLHIVDEKIRPKNVEVPETLILKKGEHGRITVMIDPTNAFIDRFQFRTDKNDIIDINMMTGAVTALKEGTVSVTVYVFYNGDKNDPSRLTWEKICMVTVIEEPVVEPVIEKEQVTEPVSMNPVHGVPTGMNTHFAEMISMLVSSIIGIYLLIKKER
ncbi:MAG: CotH kinase family protein [Faecalicoccus sp.]|nr:CotH kinase family protein [Faecalicoccus sp.]